MREKIIAVREEAVAEAERLEKALVYARAKVSVADELLAMTEEEVAVEQEEALVGAETTEYTL